MKGRITGRRMAAMFVAFFGVVIAVNVFMAVRAVGGFGGTVVDNSYVASQNFNAWLAEARADAALGWRATAARGADGRVTVTIRDRDGQALDGALTGDAETPLGRQTLGPVRWVGDGPWTSAAPIPGARLRLTLALARGSEVARFRVELP